MNLFLEEQMMEEVDYMGDGVYVEFDGFGIMLKANDHLNPTDEIYLEPEVLDKVIAFRERMKKKYAKKNEETKT